MNLIEAWGSGFPRILQECKDYGLREPEILEFGEDLRINLYRSAKTDQTDQTDQTAGQTSQTGQMPGKLERAIKHERRIVTYLQKSPQATQNELAAALDLPLSTIKYHTRKLQERGIILREGSNRKGLWIVRGDSAK